MKISVCVASVRPATLVATVESIRRQTWTDWELIIVGQGDDPVLRAVGEDVMARDRRIRYVHLEQRGLSHARNVGVQLAEGDVVAFTDDDCEASEDWLATLAECFDAEPEVEVVGGALVAPPPSRRGPSKCPAQIPTETFYDPVAAGHKAPAGWDWWGANFALRPRVYQRAGPFDEYFGIGATFRHCEDTDYKLRLEVMGVKMRTTPRSVVNHTFGHRYGFRTLLRRSLDAAWGHGALSGKLTLAGDPRGREFLWAMRRGTLEWMRRRRPERLALSILQLWYFTRAYRQCLRDYRVDPARGVLQPAAAGGLHPAMAGRR
jgi:glycosyltransferase involved in cell wall biosynthesis